MIDRKNVKNLYALTPLQEGMLFHALRDPESRAYFERIEFGLDGTLDLPAWRAAWQDITDRHDILRTVFVVRNTPRPVQVVLKQWPVALVEEDLSALDAAAQRARINAWKADDLARGFDPTKEVPLRLAVFRLDATHHRVVWGFHHILLDGWCLAILQQEHDACYLARLSGNVAHLPPAPPYAAYVRWLEERRKDGSAQASAAFWAELLNGYATPTPVPRRLAARFVEDTGTSVPAEHCHALDTEAEAALAAAVRALGVAPNSVVQALWGILLAAHQGTRDAVFAATVAGRPVELPGAEATVGLFINAIPVRVRFEENDTLAAAIRRAHDQGTAARPHHATPLPEVQAAHPLRDRLIDHILVFENYPRADDLADPRLPKLREDEHNDLHEYTHYGFEFQFLPGTPSTLRFRFDARRHDPGHVAQLGERFAALLKAELDTPLDALLAKLLPGWRGPRRIGLAASFTAEPATEQLARWLRQFAQPGEVALAPYNQCPHALLDPDSALARADLACLLYRPEDALRDLTELPAAEAEQKLIARHEALTAAFAAWCARGDAPPLVVALLPGDAQHEAVQQLDAEWRTTVTQAHAANPARIALLDLADPQALTGLPLAAWPDAAAQRLGHVPYTTAGCAALGGALARAVLARSRAPFKVFALDCDNTLWQGICGEAGPLGVTVGPAQQQLQRYLLARQEEGFLLVLASKNVEADVWAVFDDNPAMLLRREHIAAHAVDWSAKSGNLKKLARQLNLGLDSFVFIDDNPAEIAEVMHHCPEVLALPLPADTTRMADWLPLVWAGDVPTVTAEDRERTRMMQAEATRQDLQAKTHGLDEFLAGIGLKIAVGPMAPHQLARVAQLTQRTNQFNLSGRRRDEAEVAELAAREDHAVLAVEVEDRFGAYGLTGVVIARREQDRLVVDSFLLSCRVLGRRVERAILAALGRIAARWGCARILAPCVPTERNEPIRQFLGQAPWTLAAENQYVCAVADAAQAVPGVELSEDHVFAAPAPAAATVPPAPSFSATAADLPGQAHEHQAHHPSPLAGEGPGERGLGDGNTRKSQNLPLSLTLSHEGRGDLCAYAGLEGEGARLHAIALAPLPLPIEFADESRLVHAAQFLPWCAAAQGWPAQIPYGLRGAASLGVAADARPPAPGLESAVAAIWAEVIELAAVPAEIPFGELGGHSLHAVRVVSRLERQFGCALGLAKFYALGSVAALAAWLAEQGARTQTEASGIPAAPEAADYPLSHSQYRIWLLSRLGSAPAAYNQCAAFRLVGPLDAAAMQRAVQRVVARHEALRTIFPLGAEGPRQVVLPRLDIPLARHDAQGQALDEIAARIAASARRPFDLEAGPLLRVDLHARGEQDHVLALTLHHIVSDGWSFGLILADLAAAYRDGQLPAAPALRYRDYAAWTHAPEHEQSLEPHRAYWRERFAHLPAIPAIPTDRPRPPVASGRGGALRRSFILDEQTRHRLDALLAQQQASLFQFLASLTMALIARHGEALCDAEDGLPVRIGTPVAGREPAELEDVVGICVNTLVLDARVRLDQPFAALLADVRAAALAALDHQRHPFDRLVEDLAPERDASRNPLFDVLVALQNAPRPPDDGLAGLRIEDVAVPLGVAAFDLVFEFAPVAEGLALELTYAADLYEATTAARLADRFAQLLASALADPAQGIGALPLIDAREAAQLAAFAAGPARPLPQDTHNTLAARFCAQAAATPQARALLTDAETLTFAALAARVDALAAALAARGVAPGARVAVLLPRDAAWPVALLAVLRAGAVYLPLEARHPPARLREVLADAEPRLLVTTPELAATLEVPAGLAWLDPSTVSPAPSFSGVVPPASTFTAPEISADAEAYLLYTSGSTGKPKGVRVTHGAFLNMIAAQIAGFAVTADDVALQLASCAFDASLSEFFLGWFAGAPVALADAETVADTARLGAFLARHGVTLATFTPSYLRQLEDADLASLRRVILAGEAVHGRDAARLFARGIVAYNAYGPTETAVCATLGRVGRLPEDSAPVPIGRPLANLAIEIRDPRGAAVPIGVPGELLVFGPGVALGYWRRPELTAERFVVDAKLGRGYRSGDLARWLADGGIEYLGRRDEQVKLRGLRVELGEIAARLSALPGVRQAAVSVEAGPAGDELVAWLAAADENPAPLKAALAATLPPYMVPARWVFVAALPLTPSGKLDRRRLTLPAAPAEATASAEPATPLESALLEVWREILGPGVGADSDFFLAGGNSLAAMKAARRVAERLDRPCPTIQVFRHPTVRALAVALSAETAPDALWTRRGQAGPLVVALPPAPGLGGVYAQLAARLSGLRVWTVDCTTAPLERQVEQWADSLAAGQRQNEAPILFGHSGGGRLALALAAALVARNRAPRAVVLADCWRWDERDPALAPVLAELHLRAADDDRALATATGIDAADVVQAGQAYRRGLAALTSPTSLPVPVHHLLAEVDAARVPPGFDRDWRDATTLSYHDHMLAGGHDALLAGPDLAANAEVLRNVFGELASPPRSKSICLEEV
jgi:amino acid adenylation domain-containing protein/FkbH-like protein